MHYDLGDAVNTSCVCLPRQLEAQLSDLLVNREQLVSELEAARDELRGLRETRDSQQQALER